MALLIESPKLHAFYHWARWPRKAGSKFEHTGVKLVDAVAAIKAYHAPVASLFETGIGLRLMHTESNVLIEVLNSCVSRGILALPVHNAIVVRADRADEVAERMRVWFHGVAGVPAVVNQK